MEKNLRIRVRKILDTLQLSPKAAAEKYDELCGLSKSFHRITEDNKAEYFAEEFPWEFAELENDLLRFQPQTLKLLLSCVRIYGERRAQQGRDDAADLFTLHEAYIKPMVDVLGPKIEADLFRQLAEGFGFNVANLVQ